MIGAKYVLILRISTFHGSRQQGGKTSETLKNGNCFDCFTFFIPHPQIDWAPNKRVKNLVNKIGQPLI